MKKALFILCAMVLIHSLSLAQDAAKAATDAGLAPQAQQRGMSVDDAISKARGAGYSDQDIINAVNQYKADQTKSTAEQTPGQRAGEETPEGELKKAKTETPEAVKTVEPEKELEFTE